MNKHLFWASVAALIYTGIGLPGPWVRNAQATDVDSYFRNNIFTIRNNSDRRIMCQVSAMVARGSGYGTQPGLEHYQKTVVIFPHSEEQPFDGPVGNPRVFDCKYMK